MRVLLLTQLFEPEPNHLKGLEYARAMREAGIDLRVLTGFPNYPGGRLYQGYSLRPIMREQLEGVPVTRVLMYPSHDRSALRRTATYLTFTASAAVAAMLARFKPDIVHAYVGPMTLAIPAVLLRAARGARVLLDVQDLWPESVAASGMGGHRRVERAAAALSRWAYRASDRIVVLSEGYKTLLCERGVPAERIAVVYNWCDEAQIPPPSVSRPAAEGEIDQPLRVLYAGNLGTVQALDVVLDAARILGGRPGRVEFTIAGTGVELERLRERQVREAISGVRFLGRVPRDGMAALYEEADALLVHLRDTPLSRVAIPQKTQMCLAAGRPVLIGVRGEAASLVTEAAAGLAFEPESGASLAEAAIALSALSPQDRRALGERARRFYVEKLGFARGVQAMVSLYRSLAQEEAA